LLIFFYFRGSLAILRKKYHSSVQSHCLSGFFGSFASFGRGGLAGLANVPMRGA